jgi:dihydrofolate synthase / folylpolyglutamate synthase
MVSTYKEGLEYLFSQLPMFQRVGSSAYKKDLTNTLKLCQALGNPHEKLKCIHIAGTNGKGTVSHLVAYGLQKQGLKVGLYTSPHYKDFRERIKINGQLASKQYIVDFINKNRSIIEEIQPSFFEITVVMALDYFVQKKVDYAIIEVGLGGRLDSTNVITPLSSVITNISYDHMDLLGDTLPQIAAEKAGIIKYKVPVIVGEKQKIVNSVFIEKAKEQDTKIDYAQKIITVETIHKSIAKRKVSISINERKINFTTTLLAPYHDANIITAFATLYKLSATIKIDFYKIAKGFINFSSEMKYYGRWQIVSKSPLTIFDSAHNEAGLNFAMNSLKSFGFSKVHFVIGFVKEKDLNKALKVFPKDSYYYFTKAKIPRALDENILQENGKLNGLNGNAYKSVQSAFRAAKKIASKNDIIYVGGSIFVVAEVL